MEKFNERNFLVKALMAVFVIQFATVGYQIYACQTAIGSSRESDKVAVICNSATMSFNETGKLALTTFLALLVPSSSQGTTETAQGTMRRKVKNKLEEPGVE